MMKMFTIEKQSHHIAVHATAKQAEGVPDSERFRNEAGLAKLAAHWPAARLVEIWNSLPGATPVRKFTDRRKAVTRIWKAIPSLCQPGTPATLVAPQTPDVAPEELAAKTGASRTNKPPVAALKKGVRAGSKTGMILGLLNRPGGATLHEIMMATNWQAHSVRGFVSGTVGKTMSLTVVSARTAGGERSYSIEG
jgi:hypothetical protein